MHHNTVTSGRPFHFPRDREKRPRPPPQASSPRPANSALSRFTSAKASPASPASQAAVRAVRRGLRQQRTRHGQLDMHPSLAPEPSLVPQRRQLCPSSWHLAHSASGCGSLSSVSPSAARKACCAYGSTVVRHLLHSCVYHPSCCPTASACGFRPHFPGSPVPELRRSVGRLTSWAPRLRPAALWQLVNRWAPLVGAPATCSLSSRIWLEVEPLQAWAQVGSRWAGRASGTRTQRSEGG